MTEVKPFAFVLMPFSPEYGDIYQLGIKKTAENCGVLAERVDEQHFSESILERVYRQIENSDFIIAEMTGKNPNVFYEVGYAHAKGKLCALVTQDANDIPFDLKHHTHVVYDGSISDLIEKLRPKIEWLVAETKKRREEHFKIEAKAESGFLEKGTYSHYGKFDLEMSLRNATASRSPEIEAIYLVTTRSWELTSNGTNCPFDETTDDDGKKYRKHLITPNIRRLAPGAFDKLRVSFQKMFWSKFDGSEAKDEYESKGKVRMELVTSEGIFEHEFSLDVQFDEFPF